MIIGEDDTVPGFTFGPRHSSSPPAKVLSDTDFADDIVLLCNTINQTQGLLHRVESACNSVVRKVVRTFENVKSAGPDGIWNEEEVQE